MDPYSTGTKLIELAYEMAKAQASDEAAVLRRFRVIYRHLATSVASVYAELGQGQFGPMGMPGMPMPDTRALMEQTDSKLTEL